MAGRGSAGNLFDFRMGWTGGMAVIRRGVDRVPGEATMPETNAPTEPLATLVRASMLAVAGRTQIWLSPSLRGTADAPSLGSSRFISCLPHGRRPLSDMSAPRAGGAAWAVITERNERKNKKCIFHLT